MQKFFRVVLIALGVVAALFLVAVFAINLYVQSAGTQKRIEQALSSSLRVPVRMTSTIVTPWSGLKASGITVPQPDPMPGDFLQAAGFHASFDWLGLLGRRLKVSDVSLDGAKVVWFQSEDGRWRLPSAKPAVVKPVEASPAPKPTKEAAPPSPARAWDISVGRLAANEASFDFYNDKGLLLLEFSGVNLDCLQPRAAGTEGHASARDIAMRQKLFLRDMRTNWSFKQGLVRLTSLQTQIGGGGFRGDAHISALAKHSPFVVDATFDHVNADRLLREAGNPGGQVTGLLKGSVDIYGDTGKAGSLNGNAHLELEQGHMQNFPLFQMLGQALKIPDLVQLDLKTAVADVHVVSGVTQVDRVDLQSQNLALSAHGPIQSSGKIALQAQLTIGPEIAARLPKFALQYFQTATAEAPKGSRTLDFNVTGTLSHPHTDLVERILGRQIKSEFSDVLQGLFQKKTKPLPTPVPAGTPEP